MLSNYISILKAYFYTSPYLMLFLLIGLIIAFIILGVFILILFLDSIYRPNIPQYPFNFWIDRVIPTILLFTPSIILIILKPFEAWFPRLITLLIIHIFVIIPLFYYWSKLRNWDTLSDKEAFTHIKTYRSWHNPRLYKHIAIAMLYPLIWGLYFSMSRYLRLGSTIEVYGWFTSLSLDYMILLFIPHYLIIWVIISLVLITKGRKYLWIQLYELLYSMHLVLLRFYIYFRIIELWFKFAFLCWCVISINGPIYYKEQNETLYNTPIKIRYIINHFFFHPKHLLLVFILSILIEILLTGKLYYGIYTLFIYPLMYSILSSFFSIYLTEFIFDCCLSDYIKNNWDHPKYPERFWMYFKDAEYHYGFEYIFTDDQIKVIIPKMEAIQWKLRKKASLNSHQDHLSMRVNHHNKDAKFIYPFRTRVAASYLHFNRVRWVHTQITSRFHSSTALFTKNIYDKITLINNSWTHMDQINKANVINRNNNVNQVDKTPFNMYMNYGQTFDYNRSHFIGVHEENIPSHFAPLIKEGVKIEPYNKTHTPIYMPQTSPDIVFDYKNSNFTDRRIHALDQKTTKNVGIGRSNLLSEINESRYHSTIDKFSKELFTLGLYTDSIKLSLNLIKNSCLNIEEHQLVWSKTLHLFPSNYILPIRLPTNFSCNQFTQEALRELKKAEIRMTKISAYLYARKVPETPRGSFPKEALNLIENSEMQRILGEDIIIDESLTVD